MSDKWYKERSAYTDSEISVMFKQKMKETNVDIDMLFEYYKKQFPDLTKEKINLILDETVFFDLEMLEIASDFLKINFDNLVEVIEDTDEVDYRSNSDESIEDFAEMINILFSEMIDNIKLNRKASDMRNV